MAPAGDEAKDGTRFLRYLIAGGIAALANIGARWLFSRWLAFEVAVVAAFIVGLLAGFLLMRQFAFGAGSRSAPSQFVAYVGVNLLGLVQTLAISSALLRLVLPALQVPGHHEAIAHIVGVAVPVLTSYLGHKRFTFR